MNCLRVAPLLFLAGLTLIGCTEKKPPSDTIIVVAPPPKADDSVLGR